MEEEECIHLKRVRTFVGSPFEGDRLRQMCYREGYGTHCPYENGTILLESLNSITRCNWYRNTEMVISEKAW